MVNRDDGLIADLLGATFALVRTDLTRGDVDGLRASQLRLLSALPPDGLSVTDLGERLGMTKQACGQFVGVLVESGHVQIGRDDRDARRRVVRRTPAGDALVRLVRRRLAALERRWAKQVGPRRYATFRAVMHELTTSTD